MLQPRQVVAFAQDLLRLEERDGRLLNSLPTMINFRGCYFWRV